MPGAAEGKGLLDAVLLLAFCFSLGAEPSSLVGFNYIGSLVTSLQKKKKSQVSWPWPRCVENPCWVLIEFSCLMKPFWLKREKENSTVCMDREVGLGCTAKDTVVYHFLF